MKSHWKFIILICAVFLLGFLLSATISTTAHAQTPDSLDGVDVIISPPIPSPGENVTVELQSFSTDLNAASIVWAINGKNYAQGTGVTSIKTIAPPLGKNIPILAGIMTAEGNEIKKAITLTSGGVDLVWESAGYVPPLYKGKSLFFYQNQIKINAMPHLAGPNGTELDPKSLVYKWTENDKVIQEQSGYGKQTLTMQVDIPRPLEVSVEVGTKTGTQKASASITITPTDPSISFYEEDPLYGVLYNQAILGKIALTNDEVTMYSVPFGFNTPVLSYQWSINNLQRSDLSTNRSITLRTKEGTIGNSDISLEIRNTRNILQGASKAVSIYFNKKTP